MILIIISKNIRINIFSFFFQMAGSAKENLTQFEKVNNVQEITSADEIYAYDASFQQSILQSRPWLQKYD
jgi:hypothetical protein